MPKIDAYVYISISDIKDMYNYRLDHHHSHEEYQIINLNK